MAAVISGCSPGNGSEGVGSHLDKAGRQTALLRDQAVARMEIPRTVEPSGETHWIDTDRFDWTEGFFPGTCWLFYEYTGDEAWRNAAEHLQSLYEDHKDWSYHDLGFIFNCSYGHGYRLTGERQWLDVMRDAGNSVAGRFNPVVGSIKSWDEDKGWQGQRGWKFPVIIDNMMNLELLFELTRLTGDSSYAKIAVEHANTTMRHHFREDLSSYHVIDYCPETGDVLCRHTAQGYSHESVWARGQAWGLYGFTMCYRYTHDPAYLEMACGIADFIIGNPAIPDDKIPYWDYNAPDIPNAPRDVSAAAVTASALYELDGYVPGKYRDYADEVTETLASSAYMASPGENNLFILKHSVGSIPHGNEIDVPLNYADYYFVEALLRRSKLN